MGAIVRAPGRASSQLAAPVVERLHRAVGDQFVQVHGDAAPLGEVAPGRVLVGLVSPRCTATEPKFRMSSIA
jgi:hypothetical protein